MRKGLACRLICFGLGFVFIIIGAIVASSGYGDSYQSSMITCIILVAIGILMMPLAFVFGRIVDNVDEKKFNGIKKRYGLEFFSPDRCIGRSKDAFYIFSKVSKRLIKIPNDEFVRSYVVIIAKKENRVDLKYYAGMAFASTAFNIGFITGPAEYNTIIYTVSYYFETKNRDHLIDRRTVVVKDRSSIRSLWDVFKNLSEDESELFSSKFPKKQNSKKKLNEYCNMAHNWYIETGRDNSIMID